MPLVRVGAVRMTQTGLRRVAHRRNDVVSAHGPPRHVQRQHHALRGPAEEDAPATEPNAASSY